MSTTTLTAPERRSSGGGNGRGSGGDGDSGGDRSFPTGGALPGHVYKTGMWLALASIMMLFATFTSALVVRKGLSDDWRPIPLPPVLWFNTLILIISSVTLERSRKMHRAVREADFLSWWALTTALGLIFLGGQWIAWRVLAAQGVYLARNPSGSFFYLLTAAHGLHLFAGVCALIVILFQARRRLIFRAAVDVIAIYWHCMDGLWIYLLLLLSALR